ncbi:MAG TPA: DUF4097 family beta strand repeat-containing protein [Pyrinomonadaceae bacterium]
MRIEARPGQGLQSTETVLKPAQGERIAISNRSGRVIITGWDRDTIETTAARESGGEVVQVKAVSDPARRGLWRIAPEPETQSVKREPDRFERVITPGFGGQPRGAKINLTVKVPRGVEIESISVEAGTVEVSGVDGALNIRNENGDVRVENVGKSVNVAVTRGSITVNNAGGDVHLFALIGALSASCIGGRVEASNTSGPITLSNIGGDVEAETTGGSIDLTSAVRANSHYRLKTMDGELRVAVPADAPGFSANLWSYRGEVRSDFPLTQEQEKSQTVHRLSGQYGNGQAQIRLDSFGGNISLNKLEPSAFAACGRF